MRAARGGAKWAKKWALPDKDRAEWGWQCQTGREAEVG